MIKVVAKSLIKDNEVEKAINLYDELVQKTKQEKGCIAYELFQDLNNENILIIVEQWESEEHLEAHKKTEHFTRIVPQISDKRISSEINILHKIK